MPESRWTVLGRVERSRGRHGEVVISGASGAPESFLHRGVTLVAATGTEHPTTIEKAWNHNGRLILKFSGVDSIDSAESLRGCEICVAPSDRLPLGPGEYYLSDLVGCCVTDRATGADLGVVETWFDTAAGPLLQIIGPQGETLVPFTAALLPEIDVAARRIVADLPEGLAGLNRAG